jgi:Flp pilus assembly protein TadG
MLKEKGMTHRRKTERSEKGQSLVELAISFTILLVLLAGTIDFGRAFFTWVALRDAAQEGASYGSFNPTNSAGIESRVRNTSNTPVDLSSGDIAVTITVIGSPCLSGGNSIQVDVNYPNFPITMPFLGAILGSQTIPINATVIDTILAPTCGE